MHTMTCQCPKCRSGGRAEFEVLEFVLAPQGELEFEDEQERGLGEEHEFIIGRLPARASAAVRAKQAVQYVRDFSGPAAECTAALKRAGKTRAEALAIVNAQIGIAIAMLRKAAAQLRRGSRSSTTKTRFQTIFRVRPEFVPTWLKPSATIKDRGDVVATRCSRVADVLARGGIRYFCAINSTNCPDCSNTSTGFACSSWGDESKAPEKSRVVCLGRRFWDDMKAGRTASMLSTLMHEPFHIYFGKYVTAHRADSGKFGGIYCIVQFVFEANFRNPPARVIDSCSGTAARAAPPRSEFEFAFEDEGKGEDALSFEDEASVGARDAEGPFSEAEEGELAMELLSVASEDELDQFLGKLFTGAWKGLKQAGSAAGKLAGPLGGALKGLAKKALPFVGGALGTLIPIPGVGTAIGSALGGAVAKALEAEFPGLEFEEREFELARRFVRIAGTAARQAAAAGAGAEPQDAVRSALHGAVRQHLPQLGAAAADRVGSEGRWVRRGQHIVVGV